MFILVIFCNRCCRIVSHQQYQSYVDSDNDDLFKCETPLEMSSMWGQIYVLGGKHNHRMVFSNLFRPRITLPHPGATALIPSIRTAGRSPFACHCRWIGATSWLQLHEQLQCVFFTFAFHLGTDHLLDKFFGDSEIYSSIEVGVNDSIDKHMDLWRSIYIYILYRYISIYVWNSQTGNTFQLFTSGDEFRGFSGCKLTQYRNL